MAIIRSFNSTLKRLNKNGCKIVIGLAICVVVFLIVYFVALKIETQVLETEKKELFGNLDNNKELESCNYTEDSIAYPVMSPNIPVDPQTKTKIGYNINLCLDKMPGNLTGKNISCVKLIKPLLKYDGIYKADRGGDYDTEIQEWRINMNKYATVGDYGSNKLLVPKNFPL